MLSEAVRYIRDFGVGVYAPNANFKRTSTAGIRLRNLDNGVYEVPATDCCFWAISGEVIRNTPRVDPRTNKLGWGIEYMVGAVTRLRGLRLVRDYRFTAGHPKFSGYDHERASREWAALKKSLDPGAKGRDGIAVEKEREDLIVKNVPRNPLDRVVNGVRNRASRQAVILQRRVMRRSWSELTCLLVDFRKSLLIARLVGGECPISSAGNHRLNCPSGQQAGAKRPILP